MRRGMISPWLQRTIFLQIVLHLAPTVFSFKNNGHHDQFEDRVPSDFRFTTYEEMDAQFHQFSHTDLTGYVQLTVDITRDQLLVGARGCLFRLSLDSLDSLETAEWRSDEITRNICVAKGQSDDSCRNFVRVLLLHDDNVFSCGTNAYNPKCTWRPADNLTNVIDTIDGQARCPYNPTQNATALMTPNGDLYTATVIDITARDPVINRNLGPSKHLRTMQRNSKWLNEPNFISTYEIGDFVYFFFRETAVEFINCGKKIYSRVGRVCKTDRGGTILLEDNWTTFAKARMNCSVPGDFPFYFDELQSTFLYTSDREQLLYAIFTTPPNSIAGSAVCVYNMESFKKVFTGPFKYQENAKSAWMKHENPAPLERCQSPGAGSKRSPTASANSLEAANMYQLMDEAAQPSTFQPLLLGENEIWTHIVVDVVEGKTGQFQVVFLATADGKIRKMMKQTGTNKTCLLEEIKIVPNGEPKPVKAMRIAPDAGAIFISTHGRVIKVPVERCGRFTDPDLCMNAQDPYCGWNSINNTCSRAPNGNPHDEAWSQHIFSCPLVKYPVNGNWSDWSEWSVCDQVGSDQAGEECMCRQRNCDNPKPFYGGRPCMGASIEVTNCSVHGGWTPWTPWSGCTKTCGISVKKRLRYCSNPAPKNGGHNCEGREVESDLCEGLPACRLPPIDGKWSVWSGWSSCTSKCQGGIQTRRRTCNKPVPSRGGIPCVGNKEEMRMCNTQSCDKVVKLTPWTPWVRTNETRGGYFQQRFRFTCQAEVPDRKMIKSKYSKSQARFCFKGERGCYTAEDGTAEEPAQNGNWSSWSDWSECDQECGGGLQWRNRSCDNPQPIGSGQDCEGHPVEGKQCNTHSCYGEDKYGEWSCWSSYGPCSVTCGAGVQTRTRVCGSRTPGVETLYGCVGNDTQTQTCESGSCTNSTTSSVEVWSDWSDCSAANVQYRHRVCDGSETDCSMSVQMQPCVRVLVKTSEPKVGASLSASRQLTRHLGGVYLVIVAVVAFIIGGIASVGLYMYIQHYRDQKLKEDELWRDSREQIKSNEANQKQSHTTNSSQISLDFQNLPPMMAPDNRYTMNVFGSLRKDKLTVNEASTLKRNSMWTNLSISDL